MKWVPFQLDLNSFGFAQLESPEDWRRYVQGAVEVDAGCRGSDGTILSFILEGKVAAPADLLLVQLAAALQAPEGSLSASLGYGVREDRPSFGYRREHRGSFTLEQWALTVGMNLREVAASEAAEPGSPS